MRPAPMDKVGVFVMTVWLEHTESRGIRARMTHSLDVLSSETEVSAAAGVEDICSHVHGWLHQFVDAASGSGQAAPSRDS